MATLGSHGYHGNQKLYRLSVLQFFRILGAEILVGYELYRYKRFSLNVWKQLLEHRLLGVQWL